MLRARSLSLLLLLPLGCRTQIPATTPPSATTTVPDVPPQAAPEPPSPAEALSALYHTEVELSEPMPLPHGFVVTFEFDRADAAIGEATAAGVDVQADIDAATAECEAERAAMSEDERDFLDTYEYPPCEELAVGEALADEELTVGCVEAGLAYFDRDQRLRHHELWSDGCGGGFITAQLRSLAPGAPPSLVLVTMVHSDLGDFTRGGWGFRHDDTTLEIVEPRGQGDDFEFHTALELEFGAYQEGGNCGGGTHAGVRFEEGGVIVHYAVDFNECDGEGCVEPEDVEEYRRTLREEGLDEDEEIEICEKRVVTVGRYGWDPQKAQWNSVEPLEDDEDLEDIPDDVDL